MAINKKLKEYDKYLFIKRNLDGSKTIYRKSPFHIHEYQILTIHNQFIGSGEWIMKKIMTMDTQRNNIFERIRRSDFEVKQWESSRNLSREAAYEITRQYI